MSQFERASFEICFRASGSRPARRPLPGSFRCCRAGGSSCSARTGAPACGSGSVASSRTHWSTRMNRRLPIRIVRFWRSTSDVFAPKPYCTSDPNTVSTASGYAANWSVDSLHHEQQPEPQVVHERGRAFEIPRPDQPAHQELRIWVQCGPGPHVAQPLAAPPRRSARSCASRSRSSRSHRTGCGPPGPRAHAGDGTQHRPFRHRPAASSPC